MNNGSSSGSQLVTWSSVFPSLNFTTLAFDYIRGLGLMDLSIMTPFCTSGLIEKQPRDLMIHFQYFFSHFSNRC